MVAGPMNLSLNLFMSIARIICCTVESCSLEDTLLPTTMNHHCMPLTSQSGKEKDMLIGKKSNSMSLLYLQANRMIERETRSDPIRSVI